MKLLVLLIAFVTTTFAEERKTDTVKVFTQIVEDQAYSEKLVLPAIIKSKVFSLVRAPFSGVVTDLPVLLGSAVKKNSALLMLRNEDTTTYFKSAPVDTPVDGIVAQFFVRKGQYVNKGEKLALVTDPEQVYVEFELPVKNSNDIALDQKGFLKFEQFEKNYPVKITGISRSLYESLGSLRCEAELLAPAKELVDNLIGKITIPSQEEKIKLVPADALVYEGKQQFLFKLDKNKVHKAKIKVGRKIEDQIEVLDGLNVQDVVVVKKSGYLRDGDQVEVNQTEK